MPTHPATSTRQPGPATAQLCRVAGGSPKRVGPPVTPATLDMTSMETCQLLRCIEGLAWRTPHAHALRVPTLRRRTLIEMPTARPVVAKQPGVRDAWPTRALGLWKMPRPTLLIMTIDIFVLHSVLAIHGMTNIQGVPLFEGLSCLMPMVMVVWAFVFVPANRMAVLRADTASPAASRGEAMTSERSRWLVLAVMPSIVFGLTLTLNTVMLAIVCRSVCGMGMTDVGGTLIRSPPRNVATCPEKCLGDTASEAWHRGRLQLELRAPVAGATWTPTGDSVEAAHLEPSVRQSDGGAYSKWHTSPCGAPRPSGCTSPIWELVVDSSCGPRRRAHLPRCMPVPTTLPRSPALRQFEGESLRLGPARHRRSLSARGELRNRPSVRWMKMPTCRSARPRLPRLRRDGATSGAEPRRGSPPVTLASPFLWRIMPNVLIARVLRGARHLR